MLRSTVAVPEHECWPCFVGQGECRAPAAFVIDDGEGGDAYICAAHYTEFSHMERTWTLDQLEKLEELTKELE